MKVVLSTASVSHRAGGLFSSVRLLREALAALEGIETVVLGLHDDMTERDLAAWGQPRPLVSRVYGPRALGFSPGFSHALKKAAPDLIHSHGLWMYPSIAALRYVGKVGIPHIISPRGMLDPWALRNSRWRKRVAGWLFEREHLERAACLHALSISEAEAFRSYGLTNPIAVIPNGVHTSAPRDRQGGVRPWHGSIPAESKVLLYVGRIHPKKGLGELVHAFGTIRDAPGAEPWHIAVVGWDDGGHIEALERHAQRMDVASRFHLLGPLFGEEKAAAFRNADAFVLPSHSEGLPVAVLEAWSHRLPVLMTEACNIPEGFEKDAAVRISTQPAELAQQLREFFTRTAEQRSAMGRRGRQLVEEQFTWSRIAAEMIQVYGWLLGEAKRPESVLP